MRRALLAVAVVVSLTVLGVAGPAGAQVTTSTGTWVGEVVVHERHLDYIGSPCPIEAEVCAQFIARYRIVPTTRQAALALPAVVGETAALTARLVTVTFGDHHGILLVSAVS